MYNVNVSDFKDNYLSSTLHVLYIALIVVPVVILIPLFKRTATKTYTLWINRIIFSRMFLLSGCGDWIPNTTGLYILPLIATRSR